MHTVGAALAPRRGPRLPMGALLLAVLFLLLASRELVLGPVRVPGGASVQLLAGRAVR